MPIIGFQNEFPGMGIKYNLKFGNSNSQSCGSWNTFQARWLFISTRWKWALLMLPYLGLFIGLCCIEYSTIPKVKLPGHNHITRCCWSMYMKHFARVSPVSQSVMDGLEGHYLQNKARNYGTVRMLQYLGANSGHDYVKVVVDCPKQQQQQQLVLIGNLFDL